VPPLESANDRLPKQEVMGRATIRVISEAFMANNDVKVPIAPLEAKVIVRHYRPIDSSPHFRLNRNCALQNRSEKGSASIL